MLRKRCFSISGPSKRLHNRSTVNQRLMGRIGAVRVVAFKDSAHRTTILTGLADEFMHSWIRGAKEGPSDQIMKDISSITSDNVKIRSSHPISEDWEASGLKGLQLKLALDHHAEAFIFDSSAIRDKQGSIPLIELGLIEVKDGVKRWLGGSMRPIRTVLTAANDQDDTVFCLVECEERLHESKEGSGALNEKRWDHRVYSIVKFDILLDDTSRLITSITEMRQLGLAEITSTAKSPSEKRPLDPTTIGESNNGESPFDSDEEERKRDYAITATLQMPGTWDFPTSHIRKNQDGGPRMNHEAAENSILAWCNAWQSGEDEEALLKSCVSSEKGISRWIGSKGQLKDKLGGHYEGSFHSWAGWMSVRWTGLDSVLGEIKEKKGKESIDAIVMDKAVSSDYNVGFSHWRGIVKEDAAVAAGNDDQARVREMEGMSVYLFDDEGLIEDVWTLKSPNGEEKAKMREACIALTSKMSRIEWA